tara:strand:- start:72 stop:353 length:282 start_codon:yes stop_codon:yes gene_type:complete
MQSLGELIFDLECKAKSDWAFQEEMTSMYEQDAKDATIILKFMTNQFDENKGLEKACEYLNTLDTCIREAICNSIADDKGNDFLVEHFGWSAK